MLRCVSRWELLQQLHSGGPTDALLFSPPPAESPASNPLMKLRDRLLMRSSAPAKHFGGQPSMQVSQVLSMRITSSRCSDHALLCLILLLNWRYCNVPDLVFQVQMVGQLTASPQFMMHPCITPVGEARARMQQSLLHPPTQFFRRLTSRS